ncbi:hypothetical protein RvY_09324 [Ramazzottius varieornatus]|uniref:Uncharacterized protein n=1 Tax=Ramazzottius varieornatus TaxID=947166 RepID=A0A1D1VGV9_RAMVA|nr:hypothetical protein RvY_09324 [Ramazzottius varieornatus]
MAASWMKSDELQPKVRCCFDDLTCNLVVAITDTSADDHVIHHTQDNLLAFVVWDDTRRN